MDDLPEVYQPIFGHPELRGSRSSDDYRLVLLARMVRAVSSNVDRPLRILDLGSAQGYLAFRLAELGHHVTGVDFVGANVALARAIHAEQPQLDVVFIEGDILESGALVELSTYDLVLGFSVLHHVAHRDGHTAVVNLVADLAVHVPHGMFEMALAAEPLYWAMALPIDPRVTLAPYAFVRVVGRVSTHLSDIRRPVLFASGSHVLTVDRLEPIESWTEQSHSASDPDHRGVRRYFIVPSGIVKVTAQFIETPDPLMQQLRRELRREAHVLAALARTDVDAPSLLEFTDSIDETLLARSTYPGYLLADVVGALNDDDRSVITTDVLTALADLEAQGLYHADLRLWNVIWDPDRRRARLIDHGAISCVPSDATWPDDSHFSILTWLTALWGPFSDQTGLQFPRSTRIDSAELPPPVNSLLAALLVHPRNGYVCRDIFAHWTDLQSSTSDTLWPTAPVSWGWLAEIEQQRDASQAALRSERTAYVAERDGLVAERDGLVAERDGLVAERDGLVATGTQLRAETAAAIKAELQRTRVISSRRLTALARRLRSLLRSKLEGGR